MKVAVIQASIQQFVKKYRREVPEIVEIYTDAHRYYQKHWDINAPDFGQMFDASFDSQKSRRLWIGSDYFPKEVMLGFIAKDVDFVRSMFRSLLNPANNIEREVSKFLLCCDDLIKDLDDKKYQGKHYHEDRTVLSVYLAFAHPETYFISDLPSMSSFLTIVGSKEPMHTLDLPRIAKVNKVLDVFFKKDEALQQMITTYNSTNDVTLTSFWKSAYIDFVANKNQ